MAETTRRRPRVGYRVLTIEVPDSLVGWLLRNGTKAEQPADADMSEESRSSGLSRDELRARAQRARETAGPALKGGTERIKGAASAAKEQAVPIASGLKDSSSAAAQRVAGRGAHLVEGARQLGGDVAGRARDQWLPGARSKAQGATPVVSGALKSVKGKASNSGQASAAKAGGAVTRAGATASASAKAATDAAGRAVRGTLSAIGAAISGFSRFLFWLGVVAWLLIRIFRPERSQREALYQRVKRTLGL
jgi:hypothetical protein